MRETDPQFVRRLVGEFRGRERLPGVRRRVAPLRDDLDSAARVKGIPLAQRLALALEERIQFDLDASHRVIFRHRIPILDVKRERGLVAA